MGDVSRYRDTSRMSNESCLSKVSLWWKLRLDFLENETLLEVVLFYFVLGTLVRPGFSVLVADTVE